MSHWSQEEGWWLTSDGNWYPPTDKPHHPPWRRPVVIVAALVAVAAFGAAGYVLVSGSDLLASAADDPTSPPSAALPSAALPDEGDIGLVGRSYERGDCVTWDVDGLAPSRTSVVLDCEKPHRFEVSGSIEMSGDEYPSATEWDDVLFSECRELNEVLFGGPLDLSGDVQPTSIQPQPEGWDLGDRTVFCGLSRIDPSDWTTEVLVTGVLRHPA